jgi:type III pantothenate kinase
MKMLLIDAGNSSIKWSLLDSEKLSPQQRVFYREKPAIELFKELLEKNIDSCKAVIMVSVLGVEFNSNAQQLAKKHSVSLRNIESIKKLANINNAYKEPHKLGADRFVGMIGAYNLINKNQSQKKACIIIDSGTATTIDALDEKGQHLGGLILPGLNLCSSSLLENTQQLSVWNNPANKTTPTLFAKDTTEAIVSASVMGLAGAIDNICNRMEEKIIEYQPTINIERVISGGGAEKLIPQMEHSYQYFSDLLMQGLRVILEKKEEH